MDENKVWQLKCKRCGEITEARQKDINMKSGYKGTIKCSNCGYTIKTVVIETVDKLHDYKINEGVITRKKPKVKMTKKERRKMRKQNG